MMLDVDEHGAARNLSAIAVQLRRSKFMVTSTAPSQTLLVRIPKSLSIQSR